MGFYLAATITLILGILCSSARSQSCQPCRCQPEPMELSTQTNGVVSKAVAGLTPAGISTPAPGTINKTLLANPGSGGVKIADGQLKALKIHCSSQCKAILDSLGGYTAMERGLVDMKGKGQQLTYWIVSDDAAERKIRIGVESQKYPSLRNTIV